MISRALRLVAVAAIVLSAQAVAGQEWAVPRTPWGDPDLQGDYTNKYEQGTPFERPAEFAGRRLDEIAGRELSELVEARAVELLLNAPFTGGDPVAGNFGGAPAFYDRFEASRGSRPWLVTDPPDGQIPPLTAGARQAASTRGGGPGGRGSATSFLDRSLYDRCITRGLPGSMMPANYGNSYRIIQAPGYVAITYEMVHETRIVPLDGRPALQPVIRQYMGEARGRWEGDTLVVETTNFRDEPSYRGSNPATLRLVERFRATGPETLEWSVTFDDPTTWTQPWTFAMPLTRNRDEAIFEYACHEGNRAMTHLLAGARAEDAAGPVRAVEAGASRPLVETPLVPPPGGGTGLSGLWRGTTQGGRGNFAGFATPGLLRIADGASEFVVETDTGTERQLQRVAYPLDGRRIDIPGPLGWHTSATAVREGEEVVVTITRTLDGPDRELRFEIVDRYRVDGDRLTLERSQGPQSRGMQFTRSR